MFGKNAQPFLERQALRMQQPLPDDTTRQSDRIGAYCAKCEGNPRLQQPYGYPCPHCAGAVRDGRDNARVDRGVPALDVMCGGCARQMARCAGCGKRLR